MKYGEKYAFCEFSASESVGGGEMIKLIKLVSVMAAMFVLALPAQAHHSFAMFDKENHSIIKGVVSKVEWRNPHVFFIVTAPDGKGGEADYLIESGSPNVLMRTGWKRSTLKKGDDISVEFYPLRDGRPGGLLDAVTLSDGKRLEG